MKGPAYISRADRHFSKEIFTFFLFFLFFLLSILVIFLWAKRKTSNGTIQSTRMVTTLFFSFLILLVVFVFLLFFFEFVDWLPGGFSDEMLIMSFYSLVLSFLSISSLSVSLSVSVSLFLTLSKKFVSWVTLNNCLTVDWALRAASC